MTPLERIARALWTENGKPYHMDDATPSMTVPDARPDWQRFLPQARAVLQAIREPSDAMKEAGAHGELTTSYGDELTTFDYISGDNAADMFRDMIDAALGEA